MDSSSEISDKYLIPLLKQIRMMCFNSYSARTDFSRQNLTSVEVRF